MGTESKLGFKKFEKLDSSGLLKNRKFFHPCSIKLKFYLKLDNVSIILITA